MRREISTRFEYIFRTDESRKTAALGVFPISKEDLLKKCLAEQARLILQGRFMLCLGPMMRSSVYDLPFC